MAKEIKYRCLGLKYKSYIEEFDEDISNRKLGPYKIYQKIDSGCFGQVYKGEHIETHEDIAIKVIDLHRIKSQKNITLKKIQTKLSQTEDLMMARCNSPNVVKCHDVFLNDDIKIIFMEYCNQGSLQQQLHERGKIPESEAILIIKQIINGLSEMHSHHIIHRDIKPANILRHNSQYKICDFGFSKEILIEDENSIDRHTILGTVNTMAPQVLAKEPYGFKADIWSIGVIYYRLLFGKLPFLATTKDQLLQKIKKNILFNKNSIRNCKLSQQSIDFLKATLQIDQAKRINYKQMIKHPLFGRQAGLSVIEDIELVQRELPQNPQISQKQGFSKIRKNSEANILIDELTKLAGEEIKIKVEKTEDIVYKKLKQDLYKCLKVDVIYNSVIRAIIKQNIVDMQERDNLEMFYLIICRCFFDLSDLNSTIMSKNRQVSRVDPAVKQTRQKIQTLFKEIKLLQCQYQQKLTQEDDKVVNKIKDFFTSSQIVSQRENYLHGIENLSFTRKQHIRFTQLNYIDHLLETEELNNNKTIKKMLKHYSTILLSEPEDYPNSYFDIFIDNLLEESIQ